MSLPSEAVPVPVLTRNIKLDTKLKRFPCDISGLGLKVTHKYNTSVVKSLRKPLTGFCETACMFMLAWTDLLTISLYKGNIKDHKALSFTYSTYQNLLNQLLMHCIKLIRTGSICQLLVTLRGSVMKKYILCCNLSCTSHEQFVIRFIKHRQ